MTFDPWLLITFGLIGLVSLLPRASFIVLGEGVALPSAVQRALRYAPAAALAALIVPEIVTVTGEVDPINPKVAAAIAVVVTVLLVRNPLLPFVVGMAVLLAIHAAS